MPAPLLWMMHREVTLALSLCCSSVTPLLKTRVTGWRKHLFTKLLSLPRSPKPTKRLTPHHTSHKTLADLRTNCKICNFLGLKVKVLQIVASRRMWNLSPLFDPFPWGSGEQQWDHAWESLGDLTPTKPNPNCKYRVASRKAVGNIWFDLAGNLTYNLPVTGRTLFCCTSELIYATLLWYCTSRLTLHTVLKSVKLVW